MKWISKVKDSFVLGLFSGAGLLTGTYFLFEYIRSTIADACGNPYMFQAPRVQLCSLLVNILAFRFLLVNYDREKTAKGILFISVMSALTYFYYFYRFLHHS